MSNVTVQEALKAAIEVIEQAIPDKRGEFEEQQKLYENYSNLAYKYDYLKVEADEMQQALDKCKAALSDIEKCEPVAYMSRSKMTDYAISLLPTRIARETKIAKGWSEWHPVDNEKYKFYLNSIGKSDWLSDYEFIPLYTSPQTREWVGLSYDEIESLYDGGSWHEFANAISEKLKQLNTKG